MSHSISYALHQIIIEWSVLQSKFYQAWSSGTLKREALARYASEYGSFIALIARGWDAHGEKEIAEEERKHFELWKDFAKGVGEEVKIPCQAGMAEIAATAERLFGSPESALGALYAFEAQQPDTASSKLKGLKEHYKEVTGSALTYFEIHENDLEEPALLLKKMEALSDESKEKAIQACSEMSKVLRTGLDSLYDEYHQGMAC